MISVLQSIFSEITNAFQSLMGGIRDFVQGIVKVFKFIGSVAAFVWTALNLIPPIYQIFGGIIITVLILYVIVGRNAGGE